MIRYLKRLNSSTFVRMKTFPMYGGSAPSLHRESTDSLIFCIAPDPPTGIFGTYYMPTLADYEEQTAYHNRISNTIIDYDHRIVCYDQIIYDDMRVELAEYAGLTLNVLQSTVISEVRPAYDSTSIHIIDDDSKSINFVKTDEMP